MNAVATGTTTATQAPVTFDVLAGDYFFGDGTGRNCTLKLQKPDTFSFVWKGCLGTYGQNDGKARVADGKLCLVLNKPNPHDGFGGTPTEFIPVQWGTRSYLVPPDEMAEFCSAINRGSEPRKRPQGMFYLRQDDWSKPASATPVLPAEFTKFILDKPARGKVTRRIGKYAGWANIGAKDGLCPGMILEASDTAKSLYSFVRVEAVEPDRCRIKSQYPYDKSDQLAVGEAVVSRSVD